MTLEQIENMSVAELKATRTELIEAARGLPPEDVAARYVQARTDAKARDETLAKQGRTITALQDGAAAAKQQVESLRADLNRQGQLLAVANEESTALRNLCDEQGEHLCTERARADRLKAVALRNHRAVSQAAKLLNEALADNAIDNADKGEA